MDERAYARVCEDERGYVGVYQCACVYVSECK